MITGHSNILVTGSAGFIGFHLVKKLVGLGYSVTGLDNLNDYYDVNLKLSRLEQCGIDKHQVRENEMISSKNPGKYQFIKINLQDKENLFRLFKETHFDYIIHLAAQAGVRYSIDHPDKYIESNLVGFANILEACRHFPPGHFLFASSSSVYGMNKKTPFSEADMTDQPISLYGATKKSNELMAHAYSCLYDIRVTGLRFFTVYGPWGRPDMSYFLFTKAILEGQSIKVFNQGNMKRDFTYVDDVVNALVRIIDQQPVNKQTDHPPFKVYNIGNSSPIELSDFITCIEELLGKKANKEYLPLQSGDLASTYADMDLLVRDFGYKPSVGYKAGLAKFVEWYINYYSPEKN